MKNNLRWVALNILAVLGGIGLLLQQFYLDGNSLSVWGSAWFVATIALCFSYVSYGFWVFFASTEGPREIKPKSLPVMSFVLVAAEPAVATAGILSAERTVYIIVSAVIFAAENAFRIVSTIKAVRSGTENAEYPDRSRFGSADPARMSDEEVDIAFCVGVSVALAFAPLLPVISMGLESPKSLAICYHALLSAAALLGFLCLRKLLKAIENFRAERTKLKILCGLLVFDQIASTAFVWLVCFFGTDCFRAFAVALAIISTAQVLSFAAVPLSALVTKIRRRSRQNAIMGAENFKEIDKDETIERDDKD